MGEFIQALQNPDIAFLRYAVAAGIFASVAFGIIGTYVVVRRITYIAGAVSHCVLGGIGVGLYLERAVGWTCCDPMYGAVVSAILAAIIIGLVSLHAKQREDTAIGAVWVVGMAVGLLFLSKTPGYTDPMSYLFGNILFISPNDLWIVGILDAVIVALSLLFYNKLIAVCFDEEYVRLRGVSVDFYYLLLLCLTALTVVLLVRIVGIVMVIALLTLPAAVAGHFSRYLWHTMALAIVFCMFFIVAGLGVSYTYNLSSGPTIIIIAASVYFAVIFKSSILRRFFKPGPYVSSKET